MDPLFTSEEELEATIAEFRADWDAFGPAVLGTGTKEVISHVALEAVQRNLKRHEDNLKDVTLRPEDREKEEVLIKQLKKFEYSLVKVSELKKGKQIESSDAIAAQIQEHYLDQDPEKFQKLQGTQAKDLTPDQMAMLISDPQIKLPRFKFLLMKLRVQKIQNENSTTTAEVIEGGELKKNSLERKLDVGKKLVDAVDDAWGALKPILAAKTGLSPKALDSLGAIFVGSAGALIHLYEGFQAAKEGFHLYKHWLAEQGEIHSLKKLGEFMLGPGSGYLARFMFAGAGAGLGLTLIASALGAAVVGMTVPISLVLVPAFLTAVYSLVWWEKSVMLTRAKENEREAAQGYQDFLSTNQGTLDSLLKKIKDPETAKNTDVLLKAQEEYAELQGQLDGKKQHYLTMQAKRLEAEHAVVFSAFEVGMSTLVLVGTVLGASTLLGAASVASFGALPLALLIIGIVGGAIAKWGEHKDEKSDFSFTRKLRKWFSSGETQDLQSEHDLKPSHDYTPHAEDSVSRSSLHEDTHPLLEKDKKPSDTRSDDKSEQYEDTNGGGPSR